MYVIAYYYHYSSHQNEYHSLIVWVLTRMTKDLAKYLRVTEILLYTVSPRLVFNKIDGIKCGKLRIYKHLVNPLVLHQLQLQPGIGE